MQKDAQTDKKSYRKNCSVEISCSSILLLMYRATVAESEGGSKFTLCGFTCTVLKGVVEGCHNNTRVVLKYTT